MSELVMLAVLCGAALYLVLTGEPDDAPADDDKAGTSTET